MGMWRVCWRQWLQRHTAFHLTHLGKNPLQKPCVQVNLISSSCHSLLYCSLSETNSLSVSFHRISGRLAWDSADSASSGTEAAVPRVCDCWFQHTQPGSWVVWQSGVFNLCASFWGDFPASGPSPVELRYLIRLLIEFKPWQYHSEWELDCKSQWMSSVVISVRGSSGIRHGPGLFVLKGRWAICDKIRSSCCG